ncbi:hypothetical protein GGI01_001391 [Coemansia sp. RSA 376]|nr:hypothetical protein GGI01_001391 [Coemansia sp. RSA 376]
MSNGNIGATSATYTDVTRTNIRVLSKDISAQIAKAKFISIDTEFTGLVLSNASRVFNLKTTEWVTRATDMRDRYRAMSNIAKTHALVSMGLSTFSIRHTRPGSYNVHNFNFLLQSQNSHLISPPSISFLAETGFDLCRQATKGIRYFSGPNPKPVEVKTEAINEEGFLIREVFLDIVRAGVPLVVHNGLFDLVYLYQSFFGPLPDTYESFAFDLNEMFPGAYDAFMTGYIFASFRLVLEDKMSDYKNKVYLMGSDNPLLIQAGPYANTSITYIQTMRLMNTAAAEAAKAAETAVAETAAAAAETASAEPLSTDVADQQENAQA